MIEECQGSMALGNRFKRLIWSTQYVVIFGSLLEQNQYEIKDIEVRLNIR